MPAWIRELVLCRGISSPRFSLDRCATSLALESSSSRNDRTSIELEPLTLAVAAKETIFQPKPTGWIFALNGNRKTLGPWPGVSFPRVS